MARETLTDRRLKALKPAPEGKRYDIGDAIVPGLGVRVTDKGTITFTLTTRYPGSSNPTRRALGEYGALELAEAREKARGWIALVKKGVDPSKAEAAEREAREQEAQAKDGRAFETVLARYIAARRRDGVRKVDEDDRDFRRECLPTWKGKAVDDITMTDILKVVEGIRDRGKVRQALNVAQKIGTFLSWCADDELIPASPYRPKRIRIAIGERASRDRVLSDDEIRAFWKATEKLEATYRDVYRALLLTGQRLNDIAQASWSEIDLDKKTLTVPAARFKSDRDHVVPLTDDAVNILSGVAKWKNCSWVFSLDGKHAVTIGDKVKQRLDKHMLEALREVACDQEAEIAPWVNHDLRRTVRTRLSELDVLDEIAEAVIGHVPTTLVRTYNQSDRLRVKMDALKRWEGELRTIVGRKSADNVVPLRMAEAG